MADKPKRPEPDLTDKTKGRLVEDPDSQEATPVEQDVAKAEDALDKGEGQPS